MKAYEFDSCLDEISSYFPLFTLSHKWQQKWWMNFQTYSKEQFIGGVEIYCDDNDREPTIPKMKEAIRKFVNINAHAGVGLTDEEFAELPSIKAHRKNHKLEFCMDVLGVDVVIDELKRIVGDPKTVSWNQLMSRNDWVPKYKAKRDEMFAQAIEFAPELYERRREQPSILKGGRND